ncbi:hypothetical protein BDZ89DRAFT_1161429 [Hymenopellis radicata]|nr:hypothetical protein BDZ89DRAFT_1161429 [Hymenopellis radicata]
MFNQSQIVRYFDQCTDDAGICEVLSAYAICKFLNGSDCAGVLRKIHYLCCYLRVTGRGHIIRTGETAFKAISFEAALGSTRIGSTPVATKPGLEVWNILRQSASKKRHSQPATEQTYGGPGTLRSFLTPRQLSQLRRVMDDSAVRPAWLEQYHSKRCGIMDAIAFSLPDYDSRIDTLPLYTSNEIIQGLQSVERLIEDTVTRIEQEEGFM